VARDRAFMSRLGIEPLIPPAFVADAQASPDASREHAGHEHGPGCAHGHEHAPVRPGSSCNATRQR
jgi:hypothetical protein